MPMQLDRWLHSLRFKTTIAITGALIVLLGTTAVVRYERHRDQELASASARAAFTSDVIQASLYDVMRTQDLSDVHNIIAQIGQQPGIKALYLLDANDHVRWSAPAESSGEHSLQSEPSPQGDPALACLVDGNRSLSTGVINTAAGGVPVLSYCRPITNEPACSGCHDSSQPILGTLVSDFSLDETTRFLNADLGDTLLTGLGSLMACILVIQLLLSHFALGKLERFAPILRRFGQGDLALRLPLEGKDEIEQLASSFNQMADGLQARERENARLYRELKERQAARSQLLQQIIAAQEEERKKLSRELHDGFSQSLSALSMTLETTLQTIPAEALPLRRQLERIQSLTVDTLGEASRWMQDLRPRLLDDMGLEPAIRLYAESRLGEADIAVQVRSRGIEQRLPSEIETTLFRVIQEAVSNVAKHSRAHHVLIEIDRYETGQIVARVQDDGAGFVPGQYLQVGDDLRGAGLLSMRERMALLGGKLTIESTPGRGTVVRAEVPWKTILP